MSVKAPMGPTPGTEVKRFSLSRQAGLERMMSCRSVSRSRSARSSQAIWASSRRWGAISDQAAAIGFRAQNVDKLAAARHEFPEPVGVLGGQRADGGAHSLG